VLWRLATHPAAWAALKEEQAGLAAREAAEGRGIDALALRSMPYTEAVVK
jgi:cytochrome P450